MRALALPADPALPVAWVDLPDSPPLAGAGRIHQLVGGYFRPVAAASDWVLYVAEDPDTLSLPVNVRATLLLAGLGWPVPGGAEGDPQLPKWLRLVDDLPRGTAVLLGLRWESLHGVEMSVPDWLIERLPEEWREPVADGNGRGDAQ